MIIQRDCPCCGRRNILGSQKLYQDSTEKNLTTTLYSGLLGAGGFLLAGPFGLGAAALGKKLSDKIVELIDDGRKHFEFLCPSCNHHWEITILCDGTVYDGYLK